jgi:hypothetical protein
VTTQRPLLPGSCSPLPRYLDGYAEDLTALQARVAHDRWLVSTGQKAELDAFDESACRWLTDGTLIDRALGQGDLPYANELALWYFRITLTAATTRLRKAQSSTTAKLDGQALTHSQLAARSRSAGTAQQRAEATAALAALNARLRRARREWLDAYADARERLGFPNHGAFVRALHPDVDELVGRARQWLTDTRAGFLERGQRWREQDGLRPTRLGDARLIAARATIPDGLASPLASARTSIQTWGLSQCLEHVLVDDDSRPGKAGFAFCSAVRPPEDVRVSVPAGATLQHYLTTVHEFGHALHFTAGVAHPKQLWGIPAAMSEAFGFAMENVVTQPSWQRQHMGAELGVEAVQRTLFAREHVRRVVAASLCYEMAVHDGCADPAAEYVEVYGREFGAEVDGGAAWDRLQTYLEGQPCYPLVYYQAFEIRDLLWQALVRDAGEHWYTSPSAGLALRSVLSRLPSSPALWLSPG